jgi:hypothetical protein
MEKIMNKTNDTSRDELSIEQLDVSGGAFPIVRAQIGLINACIEGINNAVLDPEMPYRGPPVCEIPPGFNGQR